MSVRALIVGVVAVASVGCASEELTSTDVEPVPSTTSTSSTTTTEVLVEETSTTTTSTTSTTTSTSTTTTVAPATTEAPPVTLPRPAELPPTAIAVTDGILEIDVATGATVRTIVERFSDDGVFRGGLRLEPDRTGGWFSEGYEDGWYGCESSVGQVGRIDLGTGELSYAGAGWSPVPSIDGAFVAYVSSGICLPDPEAPDFWVLTPPDRVIVRDLADGTDREFVTASAPDSYEAPQSVRWAEFAPDGSLLVATLDGLVRRVDLAGSGVLDDHPVVLEDVAAPAVAATAEALFVVVFGAEGSADLERIDLATGARTRLASSETAFAAAYDRATGWFAVAGRDVVTLGDAAPVAIVPPAGDLVVFDLAW